MWFLRAGRFASVAYCDRLLGIVAPMENPCLYIYRGRSVTFLQTGELLGVPSFCRCHFSVPTIYKCTAGKKSQCRHSACRVLLLKDVGVAARCKGQRAGKGWRHPCDRQLREAERCGSLSATSAPALTAATVTHTACSQHLAPGRC